MNFGNTKPRLYGLNHTNRDFSKKEAWGKNCFNSSFPAALCAYLDSQELQNRYLKLNSKLQVEQSWIGAQEIYKLSPKSEDIFYAFEAQFSPYQQYVTGVLPGVDLVIQSREQQQCLRALEIKLTTVPDNTTCELNDELYGCELVVRPDTIVYLACTLAQTYRANRQQLYRHLYSKQINSIQDWSDPDSVMPHLPEIVEVLDCIILLAISDQIPFLMQPVWKTDGKSSRLVDYCFDIFIWSNLAFTRLFVDSLKWEIKKIGNIKSIARHTRTIIWLFKMIYDFSVHEYFDHHSILNKITYNSKNDKAFAVSGKTTHQYMNSRELTQPRIHKSELKNIILGGGQNLLSPERRLDAIIYNSPDLFR